MVSEGVCDNDRTAKPRAANLSQSYPTLPAWRLVSASMACRREMFDRFNFTICNRAFSLQRFHKESESDCELVPKDKKHATPANPAEGYFEPGNARCGARETRRHFVTRAETRRAHRRPRTRTRHASGSGF